MNWKQKKTQQCLKIDFLCNTEHNSILGCPKQGTNDGAQYSHIHVLILKVRLCCCRGEVKRDIQVSEVLLCCWCDMTNRMIHIYFPLGVSGGINTSLEKSHEKKHYSRSSWKAGISKRKTYTFCILFLKAGLQMERDKNLFPRALLRQHDSQEPQTRVQSLLFVIICLKATAGLKASPMNIRPGILSEDRDHSTGCHQLQSSENRFPWYFQGMLPFF